MTHAVRLKDDLLAVGGKAGPVDDANARQEPHGRTQRVERVLEIKPPDCVPLLPDSISELVSFA
jgi:hypothetical protein